MEMTPPRNTKEVQCLNGKVVALNSRFEGDEQVFTFLSHPEEVL